MHSGKINRFLLQSPEVLLELPCSHKGDSISVLFTRQDMQQAMLSREWDIKNSLSLQQLELNYTYLFLYSREVIKDIYNT